MKKEHVLVLIHQLAGGDEQIERRMQTVYDIAKDKVDGYPERAERLFVFNMRRATAVLDKKIGSQRR